MKVAVVGAPGSGKSWLVRALSLAPFSESRRVELHDSPDAGRCCAFDVVLLMGLDIAEPSPDQLLRSAFGRREPGFRVVYGLGNARLTNALHALGTLERAAETVLHYNCDKCSDPQCERRLFSGLLQGAGGALQAG